MAEEFKAGCQRPKPKAIKPEAVPETTTTNEPVGSVKFDMKK